MNYKEIAKINATNVLSSIVKKIDFDIEKFANHPVCQLVISWPDLVGSSSITDAVGNAVLYVMEALDPDLCPRLDGAKSDERINKLIPSGEIKDKRASMYIYNKLQAKSAKDKATEQDWEERAEGIKRIDPKNENINKTDDILEIDAVAAESDGMGFWTPG